ncbi:MAG: hypothetical protein IJ404_07145 [Clostridia bacterium]|nr:hypothetical protein [Clostridia bacterium]
MDSKIYGGVGAKEVITFQTKIMMGAQFRRIVWAKEHVAESLCDRQNEILVACLRMGWNDAFRHTSQNESGINDEKIGSKTVKGAVSSYVKKDKYKRNRFKLSKGKIIIESAPEDFDDYFSEQVISNSNFLDVFKKYAKTATDKQTVIDSEWKTLKDCFKGVKKLDGNKKLSAGHIQKMFNIAVKLYLCLYICREELDLNNELFIQNIIDNFANADCPIDSIILDELEQIEMQNEGEGEEYTSKYSKCVWSQLDAARYKDIQEDVKSKSNGNSNLWLDFNNWN